MLCCRGRAFQRVQDKPFVREWESAGRCPENGIVRHRGRITSDTRSRPWATAHHAKSACNPVGARRRGDAAGWRTAHAAADTYLFHDTLAPLEGAGNTLVATYNNGPFVNGSFVDTTIDANVCPGTPTVRGWSFPQFGGLMTPNNAPAVVGGSYTISMIVKFSPMQSGYSRLIDFSELDAGHRHIRVERRFVALPGRYVCARQFRERSLLFRYVHARRSDQPCQRLRGHHAGGDVHG